MPTYHQLSKEFINLFQTAIFNIKREGIVFTIKCFPYHLKMRLVEMQENFDSKFGTDTSETALVKDSHPVGMNVKNASAYAPTMTHQFIEMMNSLEIDYDQFSFIDLGSGKGRVLFLAANYAFKKIIGVEFCQDLHNIALNNVDILVKQSNVKNGRFECSLMDATQYAYPSGNLFVYLFNPFDEKVFSIIMDNIKKASEDEKRKIIIASYHPLFDQKIETAGFTLLLEKKPAHFLYGWKIYGNYIV
jgi:hypothetical protein